ncbi:MAG: molybdenum cofactor biosynthesis protein MoaE [Bryobacteraceae bacterium]
MRVRVLFFGMLKDIAGTPEDSVELTEGETLAAVFDRCVSRAPALARARPGVVPARNQQFAKWTDAAANGDEIAFLPPVSGGTGKYIQEIMDEPEGNFFALTRETIDTAALQRRVLRGEDGAVVNFEGVVRNNTKGRATRFLHYECYEPLAIRTMAEIGRDIVRSYAVGRIAMVHRLGRMEIGETSVAVIVSAPHRRPAFEAALEGINRLKRLVPIWKKEHFADGEVWVEGAWDDSLLQH